MHTGTVIWFKNDRGFGFISPSNGGADVFVHHSNLLMEGYRKLAQGEQVEYEIETGPNGKPQATNVRVIQQVA